MKRREVSIDNWREQLRRGGLELAILSAIAGVPRYGLDIVRHLKESTDLLVTEGTIYPILARLAKEGTVRAEWVADEGPHPRKYYRLTDRGRLVLDEMLLHWDAFTEKVDRLVGAVRGARK
jgi:PadR family transcriptional regulator, regulatory protein PadR